MAVSVLDLAPGLYTDVSEADYHRRVEGLVSKSVLDLVARSPAHYLAWLRGKLRDDSSPALEFGTAFHCCLLQPQVFMQTYIVMPEFGDLRFNVNKAKRDAWKAEHKVVENDPRKFIDQATADTLMGMFRAVHEHENAGKMIRDGLAEVTVRWKDEETGLACKSRADYYVERLATAIDVKTTEDARETQFARSVASYGYHRQRAFYGDGFAAIDRPLENFVFLAVEKSPPYAVGLYAVDREADAIGRDTIRRDMATLRDCIERGAYPAYDPNIKTLRLPGWARETDR